MYSKLTLSHAFHLTVPQNWPISVLPVLLGCVMVYDFYSIFSLSLFLLTLICAVLAQCTVNTLNNCRDAATGNDTKENCVYHPGDNPIISGGVPPQSAFNLAMSFAAIAFLAGIYIALKAGAGVMLFALAGSVAVLSYTMGKHPVAATPFGEPLSGLALGGILPWAAFYIQSGIFRPRHLLLFFPGMIGTAMVMLANNITDLEKDLVSGRHTLPSYTGRKAARFIFQAGILLGVLSLGAITALYFSSGFPAWLIFACVAGRMMILVKRTSGNPMTADTRMQSMTGASAAQRWLCAGQAAIVLADILWKYFI